MRGVNRVILVGRLGRDPEVRYGRSGTPWCSLSVATERSVKNGEGWEQVTDWHRVKVFGRQAEQCGARLRRGSLAAIEGPMTYDTWTDDDGVKRTTSTVYADRVEFLADLRPAIPREQSAAA